MKRAAVRIVSHPLVRRDLALLRSRSTPEPLFRELLEEISLFLAYEIARGLPMSKTSVRTPVGRAEGVRLQGEEPAVAAVLRAGLGMVGGVLKLFPRAKVGHIGLYRDPGTLRPVEYYRKLPPGLDRRLVILADPMLATGHSAAMAADILKESGAKNIVLMCLVAAPEGVRTMRRAHPDISITAAALDEKLNSHGYIVPGLGDAGDRLFGTL